MLRILQVGLGSLGRLIAGDLAERGLGRVVAAVDVSPDLAGRRLSEFLVGADPAARVLESFKKVPEGLALDAAVVTTRSDLRLCAPTFRELLRRGVAVVSTCEELVFPWLRHRELAAELHQLALKHGGKLLGTGVNPGFLMDALPLFATSVCRSIRSVEVFRIQDASGRRLPFQQKIGAGLDAAEFERQAAEGRIRHVGLGESLHFLAHYLGFRIDRWEEEIGPVLAERELPSGFGPIPMGKAAGVRQVATAFLEGRAVIRLEFQAAIGQRDPHDRIVVEGEPRLDLRFQGGVHGDAATSAIVLNSLNPLLRARPGLHSMATLPLVSYSPPEEDTFRTY